MNRIAKTAVAATGVVAVAVPTSLALASPASADAERTGTCRGATFELSVDREGGRYEVDAELDGAAAGTRWRIQLRQDGQRFVNVVRTADREGDIDLRERIRPNTSGSDVFALRVKRVGNFDACVVTVTQP